jgi:uncharacterized protein
MALLKQVTQRLVLSGALIGLVIGSPRAAAAQNAATAGATKSHVTTQGYGEVRVRPDSLRVIVGVETEAATLDKARREVNTKMQEVIRSLNALGIRGVKLQTQALQLFPVYDERERPAKITGYRALNQVTVTLRGVATADLGDHASQIIDAALKSGANRAGDVSFYLHDAAAAQGKALKAAVEDAARNAQTMAEAAGLRVIKLQSLEQGASFRPTALRYSSLGLARADLSTPVETGEMVITSSVNASFLIAK